MARVVHVASCGVSSTFASKLQLKRRTDNGTCVVGRVKMQPGYPSTSRSTSPASCSMKLTTMKFNAILVFP